MLNAARHLLDSGYRVLRLNLRGCGPSRPHCREHYHSGAPPISAACCRNCPKT